MCVLGLRCCERSGLGGGNAVFHRKTTQLAALGRLSEASAGSLAHLSLVASYHMLVENMSFARDIPHLSDVYVCAALL